MQTAILYNPASFQVNENGTLIMPVQESEMDWEVFTNELEFE